MENDSKELVIRMKIPFIGDPDINSKESMIFHKWLPLSDEEFIFIESESIRLKFWFDIKSTWWASQPDENEIKKWVNITAHYIYADLTIRNLDEEILNFLVNPESFKNNAEEGRLVKQCDEMGKQWMLFTLTHFNRLIAFAQSNKGQFWLHEYPLDTDYYLRFESQAKIFGGNWFTFDPIHIRSFSVIMPSEYERYFEKNSWILAKEFVISNTKPDLHLYLLAGAEALFQEGNTRVALTEAVAALEVIVYNFSREYRGERILSDSIKDRLGLENLENIVKHLGFSTTINYLFPLIFDEKQIPLKIIKDCQDAIMVRGNVIHRGQREIDSKDLQRYMKSIRELCKLLGNLT